LNFQIHPGSPIPLFQQLKNEIRCAIATNELRSGVKLPSVRVMADTLGVSPTVVARAYSELIDEGLLTSRPRSRTEVAELANANVQAFSERDLAKELSLLLFQAKRFGLDDQAFLRVAAEVVEKDRQHIKPQITVIECLHEQAGILGRELVEELGIAVQTIPLLTFQQNPQQVATEFTNDIAVVTTPPHYKAVRDLLPLDAPPLLSISTTPNMDTLLTIADTPPEAKIGVVTQDARYGDVILSYVQKIGTGSRSVRFVLLDDEDPLRELVREVDLAVATPACMEKVTALTNGHLRVIEFTFHVDRNAILMLEDMLA
jgi:GntR family transcriptional regulator